MWDALHAAGGPLDDRGPLAHLRPASRAKHERAYDVWLRWLAGEDADALVEPPAARATPGRLSAWSTTMSSLAPTSRLSLLESVLRLLTAASPDLDWRLPRRLLAAARREAAGNHGARKRGRIVCSAMLLKVGLRLCGPEAEAAPTPIETARRRRDGLMVAFLALMPIRRRAFVELELGRSLVVLDGGFLVALSGDQTKSGEVWEAPTPLALLSPLRRYLEEARLALMARDGVRHDLVWVGDRGRPYHPVHLSQRIGAITHSQLGVSIAPHFFRDAAATTLARTSPDAARLTRALLGHSSYRTAERHYNHARGIEAGRDYAAVLDRLMAEEDD